MDGLRCPPRASGPVSNVCDCNHGEPPAAAMWPFFRRFPVFLLAAGLQTLRLSGMFPPLRAASARAAVENPLQARLHCPHMSDSSRMRSMRRSVYIPAPAPPPPCLMIQSHDKLATSSNKLSSPLRSLDARSHVPSTPSTHTTHTHQTGRSFLRVCAQKCATWGDSPSGTS